MRFFLPSSWRAGAHLDDHQNIDIDDEEGEMLVGMNRDAARRQALGRRQPTTAETESRLSRELEEGFMDDSDEEDSEQGNAESRR
ncbi:hypothetical protein N7470_009049 [Penicillium chermesinum]|nr:hypothetical protein N7470_009049 [Penicillium chermesinum]